MNTRLIRKLESQAYKDATLEVHPHGKPYGEIGPHPDQIKQKFIELIIRECAQKASQMCHVYPHQAELTATTILSHWGLES
jgi:hypothetical protein